MKKLILVLVAVSLFAFTSNAQGIYGKIGPSVALVEMNCENSEIVPFAGLKAELGFESYFIRHGLYIGTYLNFDKETSPSRQTTLDIGYIVNFAPNISGYDFGYFGTGLMFRTSEHNYWDHVQNHAHNNNFSSWNIPLRVGVNFLPYNETRIGIEIEYSLKVSGDKFHGITGTVFVKF